MAFFSRPQSRSAAVKIVAPGSSAELRDESSTRPGTPKTASPAKKGIVRYLFDRGETHTGSIFDRFDTTAM